MPSSHVHRGLLAATLAAVSAAAPAAADEWIVFVEGGIQPVEGGWSERHGQVVYRNAGGTLVSVPADDVDLAASAFVTWQLGGRLRPPPRAPLPPADAVPEASGRDAAPCRPARLLGFRGGETLEVAVNGEPRLVHVACLDAPETRHRFTQLGWFGRATLSAVQLELSPGDEVCLVDHEPPLADGLEHAIVHVRLADGREYAAEVIAGGLGLLREGPCDRAAAYRALEDRALAERRGLWGPMAAEAAFAAATHAAAVAAGPAPRRARGGRG